MNPVAPVPRYQRNFGLDFLRTLAICVVLMNHAYLGFFVGTGLSTWSGWNAAISACAVFSIEWLFVLSGYLIGSMMIRSFETKSGWWASARDFWMRRWFRTIPNYYLFLIFNLLVVWLGFDDGKLSWSFVVFSQNLAWAQIKPLFFAESWSLALDEWFYFLMPLLLGVVGFWGRMDRRSIFWLVALLLIAVPTVLRMLVHPPTDFFAWDADIRRVTIMHLDATGWGVAAAILNRWHPAWWERWKMGKALLGVFLTLVGAVAMCYFILVDWRVWMGGRLNDFFLILAPGVGAVFFLPWLCGLQASSKWVRSFFARIGDYSYSIYLSHYPLLFIFAFYLKNSGVDRSAWVVWVVLAWLLTVLFFSAAVFHIFEKPVSDIREKFTKRVQAGPFSIS